jgi:hypothetical protein
MDSVNKINLIQNRTEVSPQAGIVTALFRKLSLWALVILIVCGLSVGGFFYFVRIRTEQLAVKKQQFSELITQNTVKEGLLVSLKQRAALTKKVLGVQQHVDIVFDVLTAFVSFDHVTNVSLDDTNTVSVIIHAGSIPDVISMTDAMMKLNATSRIRAPQLVSFTLGREGGVDVGVSFIAVF